MAQEIAKFDKKFDAYAFVKDSTKNISKLEMKERVVQISENLHKHLSGTYKKNLETLLKTLKNNKSTGIDNFILWPYTHYIETEGLDEFEASMKTLYEITKNFTSEFGVRPFFNRYPEKVYTLFNEWTADPNEHVRRWVSEGTRPNLPWGMKIDHLKKNLKKNIQLLDKLKNDPSLYVRTSVANHMNDISWLDPDLTVRTLKKWNKANTNEMTWIVKRALRNLIKQGHPEALRLLGYDSNVNSSVSSVKLSKSKIHEGESFELSFNLKNTDSQIADFMVDYSIHYPKANRNVSKKTFKLKSLKLDPQEDIKICKKISFKKVTTRKHYPGKHLVEVQVNGLVKARTAFILQ